MPSSTCSRRYPLPVSSSSMLAASSAVRAVLIAAVTGVIPPRSSRAPRSSFSSSPHPRAHASRLGGGRGGAYRGGDRRDSAPLLQGPEELLLFLPEARRGAARSL